MKRERNWMWILINVDFIKCVFVWYNVEIKAYIIYNLIKKWLFFCMRCKIESDIVLYELTCEHILITKVISDDSRN